MTVLLLALVASSLVLPAATAVPGDNGEPWMGLASIGTSSNHDRRYQLSIEAVEFNTTGDRSVWNYS